MGQQGFRIFAHPPYCTLLFKTKKVTKFGSITEQANANYFRGSVRIDLKELVS